MLRWMFELRTPRPADSGIDVQHLGQIHQDATNQRRHGCVRPRVSSDRRRSMAACCMDNKRLGSIGMLVGPSTLSPPRTSRQSVATLPNTQDGHSYIPQISIGSKDSFVSRKPFPKLALLQPFAKPSRQLLQTTLHLCSNDTAPPETTSSIGRCSVGGVCVAPVEWASAYHADSRGTMDPPLSPLHSSSLNVNALGFIFGVYFSDTK